MNGADPMSVSIAAHNGNMNFVSGGFRQLVTQQWEGFLGFSSGMLSAGTSGLLNVFADEPSSAFGISSEIGGALSPLNVAGGEIFAADSAGVDLALKYKAGWSPAQQAEAAAKAQILNDADTVVLQTTRGSTSARSMFKRAGGDVPAGSDVDHMVDLQLGGSDTVGNMWPLDSSVNRSLGAQIQQQIKNLPAGTRINQVTIKHR